MTVSVGVKRTRLYFKGLFFLGVFFLVWQHIKMPGVGVIDGNTPILFLGFLFLLGNLLAKKKIEIKTEEVVVALFLLAECIWGFLSGNTLPGISRFINGYIGFGVIYFAARMFFVNCSKREFDRFVKAVFWGTAIITVVIGGLQMIYIFGGHSSAVYAVLESITYRELEYVKEGKIQLMTEPSLFGNILYLCFLPSAVYLNRQKMYSRRLLVICSAVVIAINFLGFSVRLAFDTFVFLLIYQFYRMNRRNERRDNRLILLLILLAAAFLIFLIIYNDVLSLREKGNFFNRIYRICHFGINESRDQSAQVRSENIRCALIGFTQKPFLGWGAGGFVNALAGNYRELSSRGANAEILALLDGGNAVSYSFLFTQLCEGGLLGLTVIILMLSPIIKNIKRYDKTLLFVIGSFFIYMLIQNELIGNAVAAIVIALFVSLNRLRQNAAILTDDMYMVLWKAE